MLNCLPSTKQESVSCFSSSEIRKELILMPHNFIQFPEINSSKWIILLLRLSAITPHQSSHLRWEIFLWTQLVSITWPYCYDINLYVEYCLEKSIKFYVYSEYKSLYFLYVFIFLHVQFHQYRSIHICC